MGFRSKSNHNKFKQTSNKPIYDQFKQSKKKDLTEKDYLENISKTFKLPSDVLVGAPIITTTGQNQVCIENYRGIIEYNGEVIKVQTKVCKVSVEGKNLNIDYFTNDEMRISGKITCIQYKS